jgi:hypothetical protein
MSRWITRHGGKGFQSLQAVWHPCGSLSRIACLLTLAGIAGTGLLERPGRAGEFGELAAEARAAEGTFQAVDVKVLQAAASELRTSLVPLKKLLDRSKSGPGWRQYLDWSTLNRVASHEAASGDEGKDAPLLDRLTRRFETGANGLEMPQFARVRRALLRYFRAADAATAADAAERHTVILERLAVALAAGDADGTSDSLEPIGAVLDELEATGQSLSLVKRVREAIGRPNLFVDVEESLLATAVNRKVDTVGPVDEVIVGTRVRGTGRTVGNVHLDLVPSKTNAAVELVFGAVNHSQTRGGKGPVTVFSSGETRLDARKRLLVDSQDVTVGPLDVSATTRSRTTGISVSKKFGKRLITKIASRKAAQLRPRADAEGSMKAREKLRRQFDSETAEPIAEARKDYQNRFRRPLLERDWFPDLLNMATTDSRLLIVARKALSEQIAAATPPPPTVAQAVLSARVHDTVINNVAEITLAGRTVTQEDIEELAKSQNVVMPEEFGSDPDQKPWSITFASRRPVEVDVDDDRLQVTIRGDAFTSGESEFSGMDITAAYRVERVDGEPQRFCLVREGDILIYPPGFEPGGSKSLTTQQTSLRRILTRRFERIFKETIEIEPLKLPGKLEAAGPLPLHEFLVRKDGWISLGWRAKDSDTPQARHEVSPVSAK